jgi:hypothetical protein
VEINNDSQSPPNSYLSSLVAKQKLGPITRQNELLKLACNYLSKDSETTGIEDDKYLTTATVWGNKLKYMHPIQ